MNRKRVCLFSLATLLLTVLGTAGLAHYSSVAQEARSPQTLVGDPALNDVANYRLWARANDVPVAVSVPFVVGLAPPGAGPFD
jgi:hypothetical protein